MEERDHPISHVSIYRDLCRQWKEYEGDNGKRVIQR